MIKEYLQSAVWSDQIPDGYGKQKLEQSGAVHSIHGIQINSRKKTTNEWFEVQDSIGYWEDFFKQKIIYPETTHQANFVLDSEGYFIDKTCFMIVGEHLEYLCFTLMSKLFEFAYKRIFSSIELGKQAYQYNKHALIKLPVKLPTNETLIDIERLVSTEGLDELKINDYIYTLYRISQEEIEYIETKSKV